MFRLGPLIIMTAFIDVAVITVMSSELEIREKDMRVLGFKVFILKSIFYIRFTIKCKIQLKPVIYVIHSLYFESLFMKVIMYIFIYMFCFCFKGV